MRFSNDQHDTSKLVIITITCILFALNINCGWLHRYGKRSI